MAEEKLDKIAGGRQLRGSILGGIKENTYRYIPSAKGGKIDRGRFRSGEKCRNLGEEEKVRYLAEVRSMLKGKWARRS